MNELQHLDWNELKSQMKNLATSSGGKDLIEGLAPLKDAPAALQSVENIFSGAELLNLHPRPFFEAVDLLETWWSRLKKGGVLKTLELKDLRTFCLEIAALRECLSDLTNSWSSQLTTQLMKPDETLSAIDQLMTASGEIRSDASETLYRLFREKESLFKQIEKTLDRLVHDHQMSNFLQDKYVTTREGRWVLPIRSGMQSFMDGVVHGTSQTKQTFYMEPDVVVPMNNRLRQVEVEIEDEIERLLIQISDYLRPQCEEFRRAQSIIHQTDALLAKSQWAQKTKAQSFQFSENEILLLDVAHPLMLLTKKPPVTNTVQLSPSKNILLLSGPNAGGKTVLLKSIGLACQMARCGLPICASHASCLPFFHEIRIGIGDAQNVEAELSTFAAHLKILESATQLQGPHSLILIDEICGSTDPEEGSALARAFIERYAQNQVFGVITSHLGPLKSKWEGTSVINGSLEYDNKTGLPTYRFLQGIAGDSLALQTAKRVGVNLELIERALSFLTPEAKKKFQGLDEIDRMRSDIDVLRRHLEREKALHESGRQKYEALKAQLEKEAQLALDKVIRQSQNKIDELIGQIKAEETFSKHRKLNEIKIQLPEIIKARKNETPQLETAQDFAKRFPTGSKVFINSLNMEGVVQSTPNSKGEIQILAQSMRLSLPWTDLRPVDRSGNQNSEILRKTGIFSSLTEQEPVLDLRGKKVDEALSLIDDELDRAVRMQLGRIKVIHGFGTEALKKSVRTHLSRSVYVKKWMAGSPESGGDGITWVELLLD